MFTDAERAEFVRGYVDCALWSESIGEDFATYVAETRGEDFAPDCSLESYGFTTDDIDAGSLARIESDCAGFMEANAYDLLAYCEQRSYDASQGSVLEYAGHDFWLTRNGHGAGFWDRGLGALGERLTEASRPYGEAHLMACDDETLDYFNG